MTAAPPAATRAADGESGAGADPPGAGHRFMGSMTRSVSLLFPQFRTEKWNPLFLELL
jgi:hypothetical protein